MNDEDLRDLFAGMALQGLTSRGVMDGSEPRVATWCYVLADAMIEAKYAQPEVGIAAVKKRARKPVSEDLI
jgi:hypothetical protein